jgi:hypothetical protein
LRQKIKKGEICESPCRQQTNFFLLRVEDEFPELTDKSFVISRFHQGRKKVEKKAEKTQDFFRRFQR